jgi:hypothetical protein
MYENTEIKYGAEQKGLREKTMDKNRAENSENDEYFRNR